MYWLLKGHFCALLRKIWDRKPLIKVKISMSSAYFSAVETMADFFNRIGQKRSLVFNKIVGFQFSGSLIWGRRARDYDFDLI